MSEDRLWLQAQRLHASRLFRTASPEHAYALILAGQELRLGPTTALTQIAVVNGKPTLGAALVAALLKRSGRYDYAVIRLTDAEAHIEIRERRGDGWTAIGESRFGLDDARRAGLAGSPTWQKFPRNLLWARALTNGVRWFAPDVLAGAAYTPEELDDGTDGADVDVPEAPGPAPVSVTTPIADGPTLEGLIDQWGEAAILEVTGGTIPSTTKELLDAAEELFRRWETEEAAAGAPAHPPAPPASGAAEEG